MSFHDAVRRGDLPLVRAALRTGYPVDARDDNGTTPLMIAAGSPHAGVAVLRALLEAGAEVNPATPVKGYGHATAGDITVLSAALNQGDLDKVRLLLDAGADPHYERSYGYRAMHDAVFSRNVRDNDALLSIVDLLLARDVDPHPESAYGETPIRHAVFVGRFDLVRHLLRAGVDGKALGWSNLSMALIFGDADQVAALANRPDGRALLEQVDEIGMRPLHLAVLRGAADVARALVDAGADPHALTATGQSAAALAIQTDRAAVLRWLIDLNAVPATLNNYTEATPLRQAVQDDAVNCVRLLLARGGDPHELDPWERRLIADAGSVEMMRLLVEAGAAPGDADADLLHVYLGLEADRTLHITGAIAESLHNARPGRANPERMDEPFWREMVRTRLPAYSGRRALLDKGVDVDDPVWCNHRFGQTLTRLPDGTHVEIGGEHEDSYDPDFCIYSDVIVYDPDGSFTIYGYPERVFPPTDFHSATLVDEAIIVIGCLGYLQARRSGETPVYRLTPGTWRIEPLATGGDNPGWISRHVALLRDGREIVVSGGKVWRLIDGQPVYEDNSERYVLDLHTLRWRHETP